MATTLRILFVTIAVFGRDVRAAIAEDTALPVQVRNDVRLAEDTLNGALAVVAAIYRAAGINLKWSDEAPTLTIILRPRASRETAARAQDAMGYTPGGGEVRGRLAFVMMNRVNEIADGYSAARPVVLGIAIAHELGHLLLSKEHSATGLMKAYLNQSDFRRAHAGQLTFTVDQGVAIRARVTELIPNR